MEDAPGMAGQRFRIQYCASPFVGLDDANGHPQFFTTSLEIALSLHACRNTRGAAHNCDSNATAWQWAAHRVHECVTDRTWGLVKTIAALPQTLQRMGRSRYPLYPTSAMSAEIFGMSRAICNRRMELGCWRVIPPP